MEALAQPENGHCSLGTAGVTMGPINFRRRRNLLTSPLFRLPTELILKIFERTIEIEPEGESPALLVLTAVCHRLREIGIDTPQLWSTVDLTYPSLAELFLERCKYDPHTLRKFPTANEMESMYLAAGVTFRRGAVWGELEGRPLNELRSVVFGGTQREFAARVVGILQRAPNLSHLNVEGYWFRLGEELPWPLSDPIPNLSTLRILHFSIGWASRLLQNLSQLTLRPVHIGPLDPTFRPEHTSIEVFLTALANCPNLEILDLANTGPDPLPHGHRDTCDSVVQLRRLRKLSLEFQDPSRVGCILSHIGFPESTVLRVGVSVNTGGDLPGTISDVLPRRNAQAIQCLRGPTTLTARLHSEPLFFTDTFCAHFQGAGPGRPVHRVIRQLFVRYTSQIVEVVGGDGITCLDIEMWYTDVRNGLWEALLHGLPRLERICYSRSQDEGGDLDPFLATFSRPFEGEPVCPRLRHLELPRETLTQHHHSPVLLKRCLEERDERGMRLKWLALSGDAAEGDGLVLEPFRDLVDEVG